MQKLLLGLIGAGIQRSLAPALHEEEARHHGLRVHYQLIDLDAARAGAEALPALMAAARVMRFAGLNITFPCKQAVVAGFFFVQRGRERALDAGADQPHEQLAQTCFSWSGHQPL